MQLDLLFLLRRDWFHTKINHTKILLIEDGSCENQSHLKKKKKSNFSASFGVIDFHIPNRAHGFGLERILAYQPSDSPLENEVRWT